VDEISKNPAKIRASTSNHSDAVVHDPLNGAGATADEARAVDLHFDGCETVPGYGLIAHRRLAAVDPIGQ
jgi:hypothetical protein